MSSVHKNSSIEMGGDLDIKAIGFGEGACSCFFNRKNKKKSKEKVNLELNDKFPRLRRESKAQQPYSFDAEQTAFAILNMIYRRCQGDDVKYDLFLRVCRINERKIHRGFSVKQVKRINIVAKQVFGETLVRF